MDQKLCQAAEQYMLSCMDDSAHDCHHVYRVLFAALDIAHHVNTIGIDQEILILSGLLHDIGREEQNENPRICHARVGGEKAFQWLCGRGFDTDRALHVQECIHAHRYRNGPEPVSMEAKILFDADKLDACGALGVARSLLYQGREHIPLYRINDNGEPSDGVHDQTETFFWEYHHKLKKLYDGFYTEYAAQLAARRRKNMEDFVQALHAEAVYPYKTSASLPEAQMFAKALASLETV